MTKRKFSKLLNKKAEYTAIKSESKYEHEGGRLLLKDVKYKGKLYADHIWVSNIDTLDRIEPDTEIGFTGTATMYTDKFGIRKQGLKQCHSYHILHDNYSNSEATENLKQMYKRYDKG